MNNLLGKPSVFGCLESQLMASVGQDVLLFPAYVILSCHLFCGLSHVKPGGGLGNRRNG